MLIEIKIECKTIAEFYRHLGVLKTQVTKETRRLKLNPMNDEFPKGVKLYDSKRYGTHEVKIFPGP